MKLQRLLVSPLYFETSADVGWIMGFRLTCNLFNGGWLSEFPLISAHLLQMFVQRIEENVYRARATAQLLNLLCLTDCMLVLGKS